MQKDNLFCTDNPCRTLHKIHTFVEAQRTGNKIKKFLRQGELSMLFRDCQSGLKQGLDFFQVSLSLFWEISLMDTMQIGGANIMTDLSKMRQEAEQRNQEVLRMIGELSDTTSSDGLSMVKKCSPLCQYHTKFFSDKPCLFRIPQQVVI